MIEPERIQQLNSAPPNTEAAYVLYWAQMNRRVEANHALAYAAQLANDAALPLLVYEALTCTYPFANDRLHTFVLEGVPSTAKALKALKAGYLFYLRRKKADANDLLYRLAANARCVVTDDYPTFIAVAHNRSVPEKLNIPYLAVDSSCIVPMSRHQKRNYGAYTIRPKIKRELPTYLKPVEVPPLKHPWNNRLLPPDTGSFHVDVTPAGIPALVASCDIDHCIPPSITFAGGHGSARIHLDAFLEERFHRYAKDRNEPSRHATSEMSPWLHFGHISSLEIALSAQEYAAAHRLIADEFLEELIVRRELAFNFARYTPNHETLDVLPEWCLKTMAKHQSDPRPVIYTHQQLAKAETYDRLWNATQKELLLRGKIHGYYRMYWGKKIIEWSPTYQQALKTMIELHDVYALDGRDPNTYTNILWCFGLHDRPWGERSIFGMLRYMSLDGMKRKTDTEAYIKEVLLLEQTGIDPYKL